MTRALRAAIGFFVKITTASDKAMNSAAAAHNPIAVAKTLFVTLDKRCPDTAETVRHLSANRPSRVTGLEIVRVNDTVDPSPRQKRFTIPVSGVAILGSDVAEELGLLGGGAVCSIFMVSLQKHLARLP